MQLELGFESEIGLDWLNLVLFELKIGFKELLCLGFGLIQITLLTSESTMI